MKIDRSPPSDVAYRPENEMPVTYGILTTPAPSAPGTEHSSLTFQYSDGEDWPSGEAITCLWVSSAIILRLALEFQGPKRKGGVSRRRSASEPLTWQIPKSLDFSWAPWYHPV